MKEYRTEAECKACEKKFLEKIDSLEKRLADIEARLNKNSSNSNKPPSSDTPFNKAVKSLRGKSGKKSGGQKGHPGTTLKRSKNPDKIVDHPVTSCSCCGKNIENVAVKKRIDRQVMDIPMIKPETIEHRAEIKICPHCHTTNQAEFPRGVDKPVQYGINIKALTVNLKTVGFVSLERIEEFFTEVCKIRISEATLNKFILDTAKNIAGFESRIKEILLKEKVIHCDETGVSVNGKLHWLHVASSDKYTLYFPHNKRGGEAMNAMGILPHYLGIIIHDGWKSYLEFLCRHGLCNAHHLRELVWLYEEMRQDWAWDMGGLLKRIKWAKEKCFPIGSKSIAGFEAEYDRIIEKGYAENPLPRNESVSKRGRKKRGKALCLLDRLKEHKDSVLLFMNEKDVPFDNNQAERDIRMMKVQQKVSGTFRSWNGVEAFCRIRSFISTVRKQGCNSFNAIIDAINGNALSYMAE